MIIKGRDSKQAIIDELDLALLSLPLRKYKKSRIEEELRLIKSGEQGEKDAAYFIDFDWGKSENWAVIHDLRLEHQGRVAQIDHLLINRLFDFYILETKNYSYGVKITETGEFLRIDGSKYSAIESPIEQNRRHQIVLEGVIKQYDIMPQRLGITITPSFHSYILVSAKSRVVRPAGTLFDTSMVIKADGLKTAIDKIFDKRSSSLSALAAVSKFSSFETVIKAAKRLSALHKPLKRDYRKKFEIEAALPSLAGDEEKAGTKSLKQFYCYKCKKAITDKVAKFCWDNRPRYGGRAYCFDCQKSISG